MTKNHNYKKSIYGKTIAYNKETDEIIKNIEFFKSKGDLFLEENFTEIECNLRKLKDVYKKDNKMYDTKVDAQSYSSVLKLNSNYKQQYKEDVLNGSFAFSREIDGKEFYFIIQVDIYGKQNIVEIESTITLFDENRNGEKDKDFEHIYESTANMKIDLKKYYDIELIEKTLDNIESNTTKFKQLLLESILNDELSSRFIFLKQSYFKEEKMLEELLDNCKTGEYVLSNRSNTYATRVNVNKYDKDSFEGAYRSLDEIFNGYHIKLFEETKGVTKMIVELIMMGLN